MRVAFVLLAEPRLPSAEAVIGSYREIAPSDPALLAELSPSDDSLSFKLANGEGVVVTLVAVPVPNGEAEANAEYSLSTIGKGWSLPEHRAHVIVARLSNEPRPSVERLSAYTRVVAAVAAASGAVAVYLGDANATHDARFFVDIASSDTPLPGMLMLWNGISIANEGKRLSLLSLGMSQLELPDLLVTAPAKKANDALAYMFDLLAYVTLRGAPLREGDTVGMSLFDRRKVRYERSPIDAASRVWRVDL